MFRCQASDGFKHVIVADFIDINMSLKGGVMSIINSYETRIFNTKTLETKGKDTGKLSKGVCKKSQIIFVHFLILVSPVLVVLYPYTVLAENYTVNLLYDTINTLAIQ